jgi:hypothetical protein
MTSDSAPALSQAINPTWTGQHVWSLGSITTNVKAISVTGSFNASGTTFDAPIFENITNTASAAASSIVDFQIGGISVFNIGPTGDTFFGVETGSNQVVRLTNTSNATCQGCFYVWANGADRIQLYTTSNNANLNAFNGGAVQLQVSSTTGLSVNSATNVSLNGLTGLASGHVISSSTAPTISSGFGTSPSIATNNGTYSFTVNVGTGGSASSGAIGLPTATNGWNCYATDITTTSSTVFVTKQTASSTTSCTVGNFNTSGAAAAWAASDVLAVTAWAR